MKRIATTLLFITSIPLSACSQPEKKDKKTQTQPENRMDTSKLINSTVKQAFEAWQNGDSQTFLSYFTASPQMTDDGNPRDFAGFVKAACGHEKFLTIDKVENDGKDIFGNFKAGQWGTFKVYFKFHQNAEGKFDKLDIGQAS